MSPTNTQEQIFFMQLAVLLDARPASFSALCFIFQVSREAVFEAALDELLEKKWIYKDENNHYHLTSPAALQLQEDLAPDADNCRLIIDSLGNKLYEILDNNPELQYDYRIYLPYLHALTAVIKEETEQTHWLWFNLGILHSEMCQFKQALACYQKVIEIKEKLPEFDQAGMACCYTALASALRETDHYSQALEMQLKAIELQKKCSDLPDSHLADSYHNLASIYTMMGQPKEGLNWQQKAIDIYEKNFPPGHIVLAHLYHTMAGICKALGKLQGALVWQIKAIEIQDKLLKSPHPYPTGSYYQLAAIYFDMGRGEEALHWNQKAIVIHEKLPEPIPDYLVAFYTQMASIFHLRIQLSEALRWQRKALELAEQIYEPTNLRIATLCHQMATIYCDTFDYLNALHYIYAALSVYDMHGDSVQASKMSALELAESLAPWQKGNEKYISDKNLKEKIQLFFAKSKY